MEVIAVVIGLILGMLFLASQEGYQKRISKIWLDEYLEGREGHVEGVRCPCNPKRDIPCRIYLHGKLTKEV
jgi:hypothetical protein